ncbi:MULTISPECIES: histidine kinase [unclassified Crossiella]|uniref:sensor histidine kinase n=1 Tax=unclassified Crossiella TaxID=2620835 RepID=UPI0020003EA0|nr:MULTISPECIES: histidine kinase [unclassified Crossiella]MCK2241407.1 histidine kinase [Crossiella sp. S99.2]MCK2257025.1 histidine kinase [Crossiella sp. S99.1]
MDTTLTGWRPLLRRQWPIAGALGFMLLVEFSSGLGGSRSDILGLAWLADAIIALIAVVAPRRPVESALLASMTMIGLTAGLRYTHVNHWDAVAGMGPVETAAGMALIATVVRQASPNKATTAVAGIVFAGILAGVIRPGGNLFDNLASVAIPGMLLLLSIGTGVYFRARDGDRRRVVTAAVSSAQQDERLALARELHDVVAHHVTGIVVQAQAAQVVAEQDPLAAQRVLPYIERAGVDALTAMRSLVSSLRDTHAVGEVGASDAATTDPVADIRKVVDDAAAAGLPVYLTLDLPRTLSVELARSVLRVVQESLTNTQKHAVGLTAVRVAVSTADEMVHVRVTDDGKGSSAAPAGGSGGYGLVGMRERVELLGGRFSAGPRLSGGWEVHAWLPVREATR